MAKVLNFPKGFLWGSSTSSYQVEGGIENCDWSKKYPAGRACDHYNRYEKDFDLIKKLNQNAHRFSIEWSRIEPEEGVFDEKEIEHYRKVLLALKERKIKSVVTLWHWTNPSWLAEKGGWANKEVIFYFKRYTETIVEELGDLVDFWVTLNEPMNHVIMGYFLGKFPPQKRNIFLILKVIKNLVLSHKVAYQVIHKKYPNGKVSISKIVNYYEPGRSWFLKERIITSIAHYFSNDYFLLKIKNHLDYIGFSYYFHYRITLLPFLNKKKKVSDVGWEIYPEGIYHVLKYLAKFKKPIYILENGLADAEDKNRKEFVTDHLIWVKKAIKEEVDVRGYFYWSLMDNFEWRKGFNPRFGLVEINYNTLERKIRPSAYYFAETCKNNRLVI